MFGTRDALTAYVRGGVTTGVAVPQSMGFVLGLGAVFDTSAMGKTERGALRSEEGAVHVRVSMGFDVSVSTQVRISSGYYDHMLTECADRHLTPSPPHEGITRRPRRGVHGYRFGQAGVSNHSVLCRHHGLTPHAQVTSRGADRPCDEDDLRRCARGSSPSPGNRRCRSGCDPGVFQAVSWDMGGTSDVRAPTKLPCSRD